MFYLVKDHTTYIAGFSCLSSACRALVNYGKHLQYTLLSIEEK